MTPIEQTRALGRPFGHHLSQACSCLKPGGRGCKLLAVFDLRIQTVNPNPIAMVWLQVHAIQTPLSPIFRQSNPSQKGLGESKLGFGFAFKFGKSNAAIVGIKGKLLVVYARTRARNFGQTNALVKEKKLTPVSAWLSMDHRLQRCGTSCYFLHFRRDENGS